MSKSKAIIESKIKQIFPDSSCDEILSILASYGKEKHEKEQDRVHLAILKLCEEEMLDNPSKYVEIAKKDYRDVLAWAEYPNQLNHKNPASPHSAESDKLKQLDRQQYLDWLNKDLKNRTD